MRTSGGRAVMVVVVVVAITVMMVQEFSRNGIDENVIFPSASIQFKLVLDVEPRFAVLVPREVPFASSSSSSSFRYTNRSSPRIVLSRLSVDIVQKAFRDHLMVR